MQTPPTRRYPTTPRLAHVLEPHEGAVTLVHAPAGYGKTNALAMTQRPGWLWYSLDASDALPPVLIARLAIALGLGLPSPTASALADQLQGRPLTITFDRFQELGDAPGIGRLLNELLQLVPSLSLRIATRTRPPLPLEVLRLEGRLFEVGPAELRLDREAIASLLGGAWRRPPVPEELDFVDAVIGGWPGALHLWLTGQGPEGDLEAPLGIGRPLHDYLHEEVLRNTLGPETMERLRADPSWLADPGPLNVRATTPERRWVLNALVTNRVGVAPGPGGWHLHPLLRRFVAIHVVPRVAVVAEPSLEVRALGGLRVVVNRVTLEDAVWPSAARRLLELLLCLPQHQASAQQAASLLWPRHLERSALNSFNVALHGLRRVLEPSLRVGNESRYVVREGRTYRLRVEAMDCDVHDLSRMAAADGPLDEAAAQSLATVAELYRGDLLPSSSEPFVVEERVRLRRAQTDLLERLGGWYAGQARMPEALRAFERLLELAPQREDAWARVLEMRLEVGDEHGALAALHRCEQALAGVEPSGLLREVARRVRRAAE